MSAVPLLLNEVATDFSMLCIFAIINGLCFGTKTIVKNTAALDMVPKSFSSTLLPFALISCGLGEITGGWLTGNDRCSYHSSVIKEVGSRTLLFRKMILYSRSTKQKY